MASSSSAASSSSSMPFFLRSRGWTSVGRARSATRQSSAAATSSATAPSTSAAPAASRGAGKPSKASRATTSGRWRWPARPASAKRPPSTRAATKASSDPPASVAAVQSYRARTSRRRARAGASRAPRSVAARAAASPIARASSAGAVGRAWTCSATCAARRGGARARRRRDFRAGRDGLLEDVLGLVEGVAEGLRPGRRRRRRRPGRRRGRLRAVPVVEERELLGRDRAPARPRAAQLRARDEVAQRELDGAVRPVAPRVALPQHRGGAAPLHDGRDRRLVERAGAHAFDEARRVAALQLGADDVLERADEGRAAPRVEVRRAPGAILVDEGPVVHQANEKAPLSFAVLQQVQIGAAGTYGTYLRYGTYGPTDRTVGPTAGYSSIVEITRIVKLR